MSSFPALFERQLLLSGDESYFLQWIIWEDEARSRDLYISDCLDPLDTRGEWSQRIDYNFDPREYDPKNPTAHTAFLKFEALGFISFLRWKEKLYIRVNYKEIVLALVNTTIPECLSTEKIELYLKQKQEHKEEERLQREEVAKELRSLDYKTYLQTNHWKQVRTLALIEAGFRCRTCNKTFEHQTHHRTYERRGYENPADVIVLCKGCHEKFHNITHKTEESEVGQ